MKKVRLIKQGKSGGRVSRRIKVKDTDGNKHVLKATVITVSKTESAEITDDQVTGLSAYKVIRPPLNQAELAVLSEVSNELEQVVDSMAVGIHGFGGRLKMRGMTDDQAKANKAIIGKEKAWLDGIFTFPNPKQTMRKFLKTTTKDKEKTGNAYWELIKSKTKPDFYSCMNKLDAATMFITKPDRSFARKKLNYVNDKFELRSRTFSHKFRTYLQVVGNKKVFFKEFGDQRVVDRRNGTVIASSPEAWLKLDAVDRAKTPKKIWANEVYHHKLETSRRTPYGMPRYTGNIIAVKGSRSSDETNIITQQNNHVPSMVISVAGGQLTEGSIERVKEFVDTQIKGDSNYSKFLVLEAESDHDGLSNAGSLKVEIKPLSENQHQDQLWQDYDKNNASKLRRSFRLPPIMVGHVEDLNRATAQESERMAEKYVYNPERGDDDEAINQILMQQGFRFWVWKSNSPNVTNDQDLVKILTGGEKTGGMTPNRATAILEDIFGKELPPFAKDPQFNPDLPFSFNLARLVQGAGMANAAGTASPQGQTQNPPKAPGRPQKNNTLRDLANVSEDVVDQFDPDNIMKHIVKDPMKTLETLAFARDRLEDGLDIDAFGEEKGDFEQDDEDAA